MIKTLAATAVLGTVVTLAPAAADAFDTGDAERLQRTYDTCVTALLERDETRHAALDATCTDVASTSQADLESLVAEIETEMETNHE